MKIWSSILKNVFFLHLRHCPLKTFSQSTNVWYICQLTLIISLHFPLQKNVFYNKRGLRFHINSLSKCCTSQSKLENSVFAKRLLFNSYVFPYFQLICFVQKQNTSQRLWPVLAQFSFKSNWEVCRYECGGRVRELKTKKRKPPALSWAIKWII